HARKWHRRFNLNAESAKPVDIKAESRLQVILSRSWRNPVPPQTDETDSIQARPDAFDRRQQAAADLAPAPPIVSDMDEIEALDAWPGVGTKPRIVPVERKRLDCGLQRLARRLKDFPRQGVAMGYPRCPLILIAVVAIVPVDGENRVVHAVG